MNMKKLLPSFPTVKSYFFLTLGAAVTAFGIECFLVPNQLAAGGVSGISTILNHLIGFSVGSIALVINVPLFILGIKYEGNTFGIKSIYATIMLSVFLDGFSYVNPITNDYLLAALYGGVLVGTGLGTVFLAGATTGGTDITSKLLIRRFPWLTMGRIILMTDVVIVTLAVIVFHNLYSGLYSIIALFASTFMIDTIQEGVDFAKTVFIITDKHKEIADAIMKELTRGTTGLYGEGMFTGDKKTILLCTIRRHEIPKLKRIVINIDPTAFVITTDVREVIGDGFKRA